MTRDPRSAYRQAAGQSASPIRLVVLLYEQLILDLQRALAALEQRNVEQRTKEVDHALQVVGELQGRLDMQRGGEVARNLDRFYNLLRTSLLRAQVQASPKVLQQQLDHLLALREAWAKVEKVELPQAVSPARVATVTTSADGEPPLADWSA